MIITIITSAHHHKLCNAVHHDNSIKNIPIPMVVFGRECEATVSGNAATKFNEEEEAHKMACNDADMSSCALHRQANQHQVADVHDQAHDIEGGMFDQPL